MNKNYFVVIILLTITFLLPSCGPTLGNKYSEETFNTDSRLLIENLMLSTKDDTLIRNYIKTQNDIGNSNYKGFTFLQLRDSALIFENDRIKEAERLEKEKKDLLDDTAFIQLSDYINPREQLFDYCKSNDWRKVYVFQYRDRDKYGYTFLYNFSMITDFTKEEYDEMVLYHDYETYLYGPGFPDKFTFKKIK